MRIKVKILSSDWGVRGNVHSIEYRLIQCTYFLGILIHTVVLPNMVSKEMDVYFGTYEAEKIRKEYFKKTDNKKI